jgi:hypothetical protein
MAFEYIALLAYFVALVFIKILLHMEIEYSGEVLSQND